MASPFTRTPSTAINSSTIEIQIIQSLPGSERYVARYTDKTGAAAVTPATTSTMYGSARIDITDAKHGTPVYVDNLTEGITAPAFVADVFSPSSNRVVSEFHVALGSAVTVGGNTFALSGGFTTIQNQFDDDPTSSSFGVERGYVTNSTLTGHGDAGTFVLSLDAAPTVTNLKPAWDIVNSTGFPSSGVAIAQGFSFNGRLNINGSETAVSGTFEGSVNFLPDGSTNATGSFSLSSLLGSGEGTLSASAMPELVPVPEPETYALMLVGLLGIGVKFRRTARNASK